MITMINDIATCIRGSKCVLGAGVHAPAPKGNAWQYPVHHLAIAGDLSQKLADDSEHRARVRASSFAEVNAVEMRGRCSNDSPYTPRGCYPHHLDEKGQ